MNGQHKKTRGFWAPCFFMFGGERGIVSASPCGDPSSLAAARDRRADGAASCATRSACRWSNRRLLSTPITTNTKTGHKAPFLYLAEREGFEPSMEVLPPYALSRGAPSTTRPSLLNSYSSGLFRSRSHQFVRRRIPHHPLRPADPVQKLCAGRARRVRCISRRSPPRP